MAVATIGGLPRPGHGTALTEGGRTCFAGRRRIAESARFGMQRRRMRRRRISGHYVALSARLDRPVEIVSPERPHVLALHASRLLFVDRDERRVRADRALVAGRSRAACGGTVGDSRPAVAVAFQAWLIWVDGR